MCGLKYRRFLDADVHRKAGIGRIDCQTFVSGLAIAVLGGKGASIKSGAQVRILLSSADSIAHGLLVARDVYRHRKREGTFVRCRNC